MNQKHCFCVLQLDDRLSSILTKFRETKRRHTLLSSFASEPAFFIQELIKLYGQEVRIVPNKDGTAEIGEIFGNGEAYADRWTSDAILRVYTRTKEQRKLRQQASQEKDTGQEKTN